MAAIRNAILIVVLAPVITNRADAQIRLGTAVLAAGGGEISSIAWTALGQSVSR